MVGGAGVLQVGNVVVSAVDTPLLEIAGEDFALADVL
jgi:hypothetical protein